MSLKHSCINFLQGLQAKFSGHSNVTATPNNSTIIELESNLLDQEVKHSDQSSAQLDDKPLDQEVKHSKQSSVQLDDKPLDQETEHRNKISALTAYTYHNSQDSLEARINNSPLSQGASYTTEHNGSPVSLSSRKEGSNSSPMSPSSQQYYCGYKPKKML